MELYKIENLTFTYPTSSTPAIRDISLTVNRGEFITIIGNSGCGKTTLLRHFKYEISPMGNKTGNIFFQNKEICDTVTKVGYVGQNPELGIVCDKVWHELAFGLENLALPQSEIRSRVAETASFFGLDKLFHCNCATLSGGQKQILNLASIMIMNPDVLVLDEPTSQLDPIAADEFFQILKKINSEYGTTILLSEHRLEGVIPISDRVIAMNDGEIICDCVPKELVFKLHNSEFINSLPTQMRIFESVNEAGDCPLTINDGRSWLSKRSLQPIKKEDSGLVIDTEKSVELKNIWFRYSRNSDDIIKGTDIVLQKGEIFGLTGGNGAGKSTLVQIISGILTPYRGKVNTGGAVAQLPQNPSLIFTKKTVWDELIEMTSDKIRIDKVMEICEISTLLSKNPLDLSGGEIQRVALAKILLTNPDIILLDEPTKGMDALFKSKLSCIITALAKNGVTFIIISHDIEFCAKTCTSCGLFFDGRITSFGSAHDFFIHNNFFTTTACKLTRGITDSIISSDELIYAVSSKSVPKKEITIPKSEHIDTPKSSNNKKNKTWFGLSFLIIFVVLSVVSYFLVNKTAKQICSYGVLFSFIATIFGFTDTSKIGSVATPREKKKMSAQTITSVIISFLLIPLTIFIGYYYLADKKYYFISLLIIIETLIPFGIIFEGRKPSTYEIVIISILSALAVASRASFFMVAHFKPQLAIIIIAGAVLGCEDGFLIGAVSAFASNIFFGQGAWTPWQMFAFGICGLISGLLFGKQIIAKNRLTLCLFGFIAGFLIYGGIMNTATVFMMQPQTLSLNLFLTTYALGVPYDLVHAGATVLFIFLLAPLMSEKLERIKTKYKI